MQIIHIESLGLDNKTLALLKRNNLGRVPRLLDSVKKGELGNIPGVGKDRLKGIIEALKVNDLLDPSFIYDFRIRKTSDDKFNYERTGGDDIMEFIYDGAVWQMEVEGYSTLLFHRPIAARVLIAMYECELLDIICTKDNVHDRYKVVAGRLGLNVPKSPTTIQRQFELLDEFMIDGNHSPFILRKKEQSRHRQLDSNAPGRGGESGMWGTLLTYPRMPIGAWQKDKYEFQSKTVIVTDSGHVLVAVYSGDVVQNDIRKQRPTANARASNGGDNQPIS